MKESKIDFIPKDVLKKNAGGFLEKYNPECTVPEPVDLVGEKKLGMDIVPVYNLLGEFSIDAFLSHDLITVYIDQNIYHNIETRYRFSIAHELGHYWLHKELYRNITFKNAEEWIDVYQNMDEELQDKLEFQSNTFASYILIPDCHFKARFKKQLDVIMNRIQTVKDSHLERDSYIDYVIDILSGKLAPVYNVSVESTVKRIKYDPAYVNSIP